MTFKNQAQTINNSKSLHSVNSLAGSGKNESIRYTDNQHDTSSELQTLLPQQIHNLSS